MRKGYIFCLFGIILVMVAIFLHNRSSGDSEYAGKVQSINQEKEHRINEIEEKEIVYENLEGLYFLNGDGEQVFCSQLETWLKARATEVERVCVTGEIITDESVPFEERTYTFYLDCEALDVEAVYQDGNYIFREVEDIPDSEDCETEQETDRKDELSFLQKDYVIIPEGEEPGEVVIENMDAMPDQLSDVENEIRSFLEGEGELRRELVYMGDEEGMCIFAFKNPRTDGKGLVVLVQNGKYKVNFVEN